MAIFLLLNTPYVQQHIAILVSNELSKALQTEVSIKQINIGLLNRIILDDVTIHAQDGQQLLGSEHISAKFSISSLLRGKIIIHNIQLYQLQLYLSRPDSITSPNYQFLIDAFSGKDSLETSPPLNLRINAILIRNGFVAYDDYSALKTPDRFNPHHLQLKDLRANISLKALMPDSIHTTIRQLSFKEQSGFELQELAFKLEGNKEHLTLSRFTLKLPASEINIDTLQVAYQYDEANLLETLKFQGETNQSYITPQDLSAFSPALSKFKDRFLFHTHIRGDGHEIILSPFSVRSENNDLRFNLYARVRNPWDVALCFFDYLSVQMDISTTGMEILTSEFNQEIPSLINRMGFLSLKGNIRGMLKNLQIESDIECGLGNIHNELSLQIEPEQTAFQGTIKTDNFLLGALLDNTDLGSISLETQITGEKKNHTHPFIHVNGNIHNLEYKQYIYQNIQLNAQLQNGKYNGNVSVKDPNGEVHLYGNFNPNAGIPTYQLTANIHRFRPYQLQLSKKYQDTEFGASITTDLAGNHLDNLEGSIRINNLSISSQADQYLLDSLVIRSYPQAQQRELTILSPFMQGHVSGKFQFATLPNSIKNILHDYLPSLVEKPFNSKNAIDNQLVFDLNITDAELFSKILETPISLYQPIILKGFLHERNKQFNIEAYFPNLYYNNNQYQSGMLLLNNPTDKLQGMFRISKQNKKNNDYMNLVLNLESKDNALQTTLHWGNNAATTYSGTLAATTQFFRQQMENSHSLTAHMQIHPAEIIINDSIWNLNPSTITLDSGRVHVNHFNIEHAQQHLYINGNLTSDEKDSLIIDLNQIQLKYLFDIINFHSVDFQGNASAIAVVKHALKNPSLYAKLHIDEFKFNHGLMGNMDATCHWNLEENNIYLDADIREPHLSHTTVNGWVSPELGGLDLQMTTDSTSLEFLNFYTAEVFEHISGRVSGPIHLFGSFDDLNLEGDASGNAFAKVGVLHTDYHIRLDSVSLRPNLIEFRKASFYDRQGHGGEIQGNLHHQYLKNLSYDFTFYPRDMLIYDAPNDTESSIYGSIQANGTIQLSGDDNLLNILINLRTSPNTIFIYNFGTPEEITSNEFITFVDKTPRYSWRQELPSQSVPIKPEEITTNIHIRGQLEVTSDATIRVVMDPISGDYAEAQGHGNFQINYLNNDDFKLYGTYTLDRGQYKLSLQEVIRKDFSLQQGGTITFNGKPENGDLNIQAVYTVNSASLRDLSPNTTFSQNTVRVNCLLNLSGRINSPTIQFDLDLPNISDEEENLVRNYISTEEQMETQIIYLLGLGRFYTHEYTSSDSQDRSSQSSAVNSLLSSTLSGQLNNMISNIIDSNQWNFGTNLSTGDRGWTDMEVEGMLSGRLLNSRLLINGNFGYRDNQFSNSNFIGDFDVQWLLTPSGDIRLKGYNQTNDRYFTRTSLTTQGIGILFNRDFDNWRELFFRNIYNKNDNISTDAIVQPIYNTNDSISTDSISHPKD